MTVLAGVAVPFNAPQLVGDRLPNGDLRMYREVFDAGSIVPLPRSLSFQWSHNDAENDRPVGRVVFEPTASALRFQATLARTTTAKDLTELVRDGLIDAVSISFSADPGRDEWRKTPTPGKRRSCYVAAVTLRHLAAVRQPAYPSARIDQIDGQPLTAIIESAATSSAETSTTARAATLQETLREADAALAAADAVLTRTLARDAVDVWVLDHPALGKVAVQKTYAPGYQRAQDVLTEWAHTSRYPSYDHDPSDPGPRDELATFGAHVLGWDGVDLTGPETVHGRAVEAAALITR